jgi:hypothetical protein
MGRGVLPTGALARAFYHARLIEKTLPNSGCFLEVGPGSGYLTLLLALRGKHVICTDVTKSLYIYQEVLFNHFGVVDDDEDEEPFNRRTSIKFVSPFNSAIGRVTHIPWWVFKNFDETINGEELSVEAVICNHAICEMHPLSLRHLCYISNKLKIPKIFAEGLGCPHQGEITAINDTLSDFGFKLTPILEQTRNVRWVGSGVFIWEGEGLPETSSKKESSRGGGGEKEAARTGFEDSLDSCSG